MYRNKAMTPRAVCTERIKTARLDLLLLLVFTIMNVGGYFANSGTMLLFSAAVPYYAVVFAGLLQIPTVTIVLYTIAGVSVAAYFACWLLCKKRPVFLIVATVLFSLDFLTLIGLYVYAGDNGGFLDMVIHAAVLYYLILGSVSASQLKKLPEDAVVPPVAEETENSTPLRRVEDEGKVRILLEEQYSTYRIVYRRVKRLNQLVINDYIYAEVEYLIEAPHNLSAVMDGHWIEVGFDGNRSYLQIDGEVVKSKLRLY